VRCEWCVSIAQVAASLATWATSKSS
jgi:hypothetical protein